MHNNTAIVAPIPHLIKNVLYDGCVDDNGISICSVGSSNGSLTILEVMVVVADGL